MLNLVDITSGSLRPESADKGGGVRPQRADMAAGRFKVFWRQGGDTSMPAPAREDFDGTGSQFV